MPTMIINSRIDKKILKKIVYIDQRIDDKTLLMGILETYFDGYLQIPDEFMYNVKKLIKKGADVNIKNSKGSSALIYAAKNSYKAIKLLLDVVSDLNINYNLNIYINLNIADKEENTPLIHSAELNHAYDAIKLLIESGSNVNIKNIYNDTALMYIINNNKDNINKKNDAIKLLLDAGADVNIQNFFGKTALMCAVENDIGSVKTLINNSKDLNLNIVDKKGRNVLWYANTSEIIMYLVQQGININGVDNDGNTVLFNKINQYPIARILIASNADVNFKNKKGETPLMYCDNTHSIELLLNNGADINAVNNLQQNTMWYAKNKEMITLLIQNGLNINHANIEGNTVLYDKINNFAISRFLIELGADVNIRNKNGETPMMNSTNNHTVKLLAFQAPLWVENGADINAVNNLHQNTLIILLNKDQSNSKSNITTNNIVKNYANNYTNYYINNPNNNITHDNGIFINKHNTKYNDVIRYLISEGIDINLKDIYGNTPLIYAIENHYYDIVKLLIKSGADINIVNLNGENIYQISKNQQIYYRYMDFFGDYHTFNQYHDLLNHLIN